MSMLRIGTLALVLGVASTSFAATPSPSTTRDERMDAALADYRAKHPGMADATAGKSAGPTRDWRQIDKNHNNLIEPAEMQAYLASHPGGQKGQ